jgi:hypothetical protein
MLGHLLSYSPTLLLPYSPTQTLNYKIKLKYSYTVQQQTFGTQKISF